MARGETGQAKRRRGIHPTVLDRLADTVVPALAGATDGPTAERRADPASTHVGGDVDPQAPWSLKEGPRHDPVAVEDSEPIVLPIEPGGGYVGQQVGALPHQLAAVHELAGVDHRDLAHSDVRVYKKEG